MKKIIFLLILLLVLINTSKTSAQFVVTDPGNTATNIQTTLNSYIQKLKEFGLDTFAYTVSQKIGEKMSNKIFNKANGGASGDDGQSAYIDDFYSFFGNLTRSETDRFIRELEVSRSPYAKDIARAMVFTYSTAGGPVPDTLGGFDLDRTIGPRWQEFQNDASVGGWDGFLALSNPANTNIGSGLIARETLGRQLENARQIEQLRLTSPGTQPQGECELDWTTYKNRINTIKTNKDAIKGSGSSVSEVPVPTIDFNNPANNVISTPETESLNTQIKNLETEIQNTVNRINEINKKLGSPDFMAGSILTLKPGEFGYNEAKSRYDAWKVENDRLVAEKNGLESKKTTLTKQLSELQGTKAGLQSGSSGAGVALGEDYARCLKEVITNPMGLVQGGLQMATGAAMDRLGQADEIGELLGGMLTQMLSSFIQNGIASLSANYANRNTSNTGIISNVGGPEQLITADGKPIPWTQAPNTIVDLPNEFSAAVANTQKELTNLRSYIDMVTMGSAPLPSLVDSGSRLDQCLPGPDFRWDKKLDTYYNRKIKVFENDRGNEKKKENRANAEEIVDRSFTIAKSESEIATIDPAENIPGAIVMQTQIKKLIDVKNYYRQKKEDIVAKQSAIGLLSKLENDLLISMSKVRAVYPTLPASLVFTENGWARLTQVEKTTLQNWAKTINDKLIFGTDDTVNRDQVIAVVWSVWENPQPYITNKDAWSATDPTDPKYSRADAFLIQKNQIRTEFNSIADRISLPRTLSQSEIDVVDMKNTLLITDQLADDCVTMVNLIKNNNNAGTHAKMLAILKANRDRFKSNDIKLSLDSVSILSRAENAFPPGMNCTGSSCVQNAGITNLDGEGTGGEISYESDNRYQIQPYKNVWELLSQDTAGILYCKFNVFLGVYTQRGTDVKNAGNILCTDGLSNWYRSEKSDLLGYFYNNMIEYK